MLFGKKISEIDISKNENEDISLEDMVDDIRAKLDELTANISQIKKLEDEVAYYKSMHNSRVLFLEEIVRKLVDKPAPPPAKSSVEAYLESKKEREAAASNKNSKNTNSENATAGPVGKLP